VPLVDGILEPNYLPLSPEQTYLMQHKRPYRKKFCDLNIHIAECHNNQKILNSKQQEDIATGRPHYPTQVSKIAWI
jgi:hypothetical protein